MSDYFWFGPNGLLVMRDGHTEFEVVYEDDPAGKIPLGYIPEKSENSDKPKDQAPVTVRLNFNQP